MTPLREPPDAIEVDDMSLVEHLLEPLTRSLDEHAAKAANPPWRRRWSPTGSSRSRPRCPRPGNGRLAAEPAPPPGACRAGPAEQSRGCRYDAAEAGEPDAPDARLDQPPPGAA